jgi:hypothetical protein
MKLNQKICELIGAIIGDGSIRYKPILGQYYVEIVGDRTTEQEYFLFLVSIVHEQLSVKTNVRVGGRGLRLRFYSKNFIEFLVHDLKLPCNKEKCKNIFIPSEIMIDEEFITSCIRGLFDTDGSFFLARKGKRLDYPTMEFSTISKLLASQVELILSSTFRIGSRNFKQGEYNKIYRISLNGDVMVQKWFNHYGFSNHRNLVKYQKYIEKHGAAGI